MTDAPVEETSPPTSTSSSTFKKPRDRPLGRSVPPVGSAERVALGMIARHGADAAREATIHLNRMLDRGDLAGRDLWACVVHMIHERRRLAAAADQ